MAITFSGGESYYRPLTFDEMMKPLLYYAEAYDKAEEDYADLAAQTEAFRDIANREKSPEAFEMYNRYSAELNQYVDDLANGNLGRSKANLLRMKRRYAQDITPIANAYEALKEARKYREEKGPDAIFEVDEYDSVDQFLNGKTANNRWQSREALTKKTAAITEAAMAEMAKDPEIRDIIGNDQYLMSVLHTGGSYKDLQEAMAQAINANPKLGNRFSEIRQQILKNSGYENYGPQGQRALADAVDLGMYAGLDKPVKNLVANQNFWSDKDRAMYQLSKNADARADKQLRYNLALHGLYEDKNGDLKYDIKKDPNVQKALAIQEAKNNGELGTKSGNNRETVSSGYNFHDIRNREKSRELTDDEYKGDKGKGTKLILKDFVPKEVVIKDSEGNNVPVTIFTSNWDDLVKDKTRESYVYRLEQEVLRATGESTLEDAFRKYDIRINTDGNLITHKRDSQLYGDLGETEEISSYNLEEIGG